jgi:hypothetical protein
MRLIGVEIRPHVHSTGDGQGIKSHDLNSYSLE